METSAQRALHLFEKLTSTEAFLLLLASLLFADAYLIVFHGITVFSVGVPFRDLNVTVKQAAAFVLWYSAFFGLAVPAVAAVIDLAMLWWPSPRTTLAGYVNLEQVRTDALSEQNQFMYKHYESALARLDKAARIRKLSIAIIIISVVIVASAITRADGATGSLPSVVFDTLSENGFATGLLRIVALFAAIAVLLTAVNPTANIQNSEYLPNYGMRSQKEWLDQIKVGLVDKDTLLQHLAVVVEDEFQGARYDATNESHRYCVKHGLASHGEGTLRVSDKGRFFARFTK